MGLFSFPNPVNEVSARLVAGGVVIMSLVILLTNQYWILPVTAYGFVARVLTGPTLSPLGQFVTRVLVKVLPFKPKLVAGPPKRFAQGIGAVVTVSASIAWAMGSQNFATALVVLILFAATLESVFAFCIGCKIFALLMRVGLIPQSVCDRCNNLNIAQNN